MHNAQYQKSYKGTVMDMAERRGFQKGLEAMRVTLAREFARVSTATITGAIASNVVMTAPRPTYEQAVAEKLIAEDNLKGAAGGNVGKDGVEDVPPGVSGPGEQDGSAPSLDSQASGTGSAAIAHAGSAGAGGGELNPADSERDGSADGSRAGGGDIW